MYIDIQYWRIYWGECIWEYNILGNIGGGERERQERLGDIYMEI